VILGKVNARYPPANFRDVRRTGVIPVTLLAAGLKDDAKVYLTKN
jgi:hypothetical protein